MPGATVSESYFWQQVKAGLGGSEVHLSRIENTAGTGISDVNGCYAGVESWIELKVFHADRLYFRTSQKAWILRRTSVGGRCFVLARREDEVFLYKAAKILESSALVAVPEKKSLYIRFGDLPTPIGFYRKPVAWDKIRGAIFNQAF